MVVNIMGQRKWRFSLGLCVLLVFVGQSYALKIHPATDAYEGWRLGMQAYSFNRFTFYEAIDKNASLGLDWIEAYPGQKLRKEKSNVRFDHNLSPALQKEVKQKLTDAGVRLVNYGVVGLGTNEAENRKVFDFAKAMGIETIVSEPPFDAFDLIDRLCREYKIKVALHNHPKNSRYWNPETVLKVCKGRSKWIGACADTGHWMKSGVNPVEALKKLEGRIISLHLKDLNEFGVRGAHDVIWGTGKANMQAILSELHRQKFQGVFSIEYEHNWLNSVPEIRGCVAYFNRMGNRLKPGGWKDLLKGDLSNCTGKWKYTDGVLEYVKGNFFVNDAYKDFILDLEFRVNPNTNSGLFIRNGDHQNWRHRGMEIQIADSSTLPIDTHICGAVYDCLAPRKNMVKKPGEWNRLTVMAKGPMIYIVMNGEQIIEMNLNRWNIKGKNPDGSKNKFPQAMKELDRPGYIGFQDHGHPVWYRNIKIKSLDR